MLYVFIPPPPSPPSPRTRELAALLGRVIEEYEKHHPAVTGPEVRAAVRMAVESSSRKGSPDLRIAVGVAAAVVAGGLFAFLAANQGQMPQGTVPMVAAVLGLFAVLMVVVMAKRSGR
ncbi:MAG TPA: hypothetical protein VLH75_03280 [Longimicrobiales bacterium]|nr:hypothetical protein [Longimicrobiales bacterium]